MSDALAPLAEPRYPAHRVPEEVLQLIVNSEVDLNQLRLISLVSRQLHRLCFPLLHRTAQFHRARSVECFIEAVESESVDCPLRIARVLRVLVFLRRLDVRRRDESFDDDLITRFRTIIPKLEDLEHITWHSKERPNDPELFTDFQRWCPKLRSVDLDASSWVQHSNRDKIFEFRGLTHVKIVNWHVAEIDDVTREVPRSLIKTIQVSPQLTTLSLQTNGEDYENHFDVRSFFKGLSTVLPCLRYLRLMAAGLLEWNLIFDPTHESDPIRSFFVNHPRIETLIVNWGPISPIRVNPDVVHDLFPGLRHFSGPESVCAALLASGLRMQLESLDLQRLEWQYRHGDTSRLVKDVVTTLPRLRRLTVAPDIPGGGPLYPVSTELLKTCVLAAPHLQSLEISYQTFHPERFPDMAAILKHVPDLRELRLRLSNQVCSCKVTLDRAECQGSCQLYALVVKLNEACPRLERIIDKGHYIPGRRTVYELEKDREGTVQKFRIYSQQV